MNTITITIETLKRMPSGARACKPARDWFEENFPNGGELAEVWDACPNWQWKVWSAVHSALTVDAVAFAQSCAARAAAYAEYVVAAVAKADAADKAAEAAEAAAEAAADAAYAYTAADAAHVYTAAADAAADAAAAAALAAYAHADVDEIQVQVAWARGILFS